MAAALRHRGPDSAGHWAEPADGVAFGFRRLAVLDLSDAGGQPMHSPSGRYVLVFNGEVRAPLAGLFNRSLDYGPIPDEVFGFFDSGVAWTRNITPDFAGGTRPFVSSAGFGARVNLFGFAIGEFNVARPLDRHGRGWMWVFNLRPGF